MTKYESKTIILGPADVINLFRMSVQSPDTIYWTKCWVCGVGLGPFATADQARNVRCEQCDEDTSGSADKNDE